MSQQLPLLQSANPAGTRRAVLAATQHCQSGPQRSGWRESVWPIATLASLNLPGKYLPLNTGSLSSGAEAAGPQLPSSLQSKFNLNLLIEFKFKFTGKFIPISSFNVLSQISKLKLKKSRGYKFKTLRQYVHLQPSARPQHVPVI